MSFCRFRVIWRVIYERTSNYFEPFFNEILCGVQETHSTQHAWFKLLASRQKFLNKGGFDGSVLIDLLKAYDCQPHNLFLAKYQAYGFNKDSVKLFLTL